LLNVKKRFIKFHIASKLYFIFHIVTMDKFICVNHTLNYHEEVIYIVDIRYVMVTL